MRHAHKPSTAPALKDRPLHTYAGQVRCTHRALASVIDAIDSALGRDHSIVIVHGDHGSRLHRQDPNKALQKHTVDETNSNFATLLAVRRPNVAAAIHAEPAPVQDVIWDLARSGFAGPLPTTWQHYLRKMPDGDHPSEDIRPLAASDMVWARRPD